MQSSTVTPGPGGQGQHYLQLVPKPPVNGWSPKQVVEGFLTASASFGEQQIAREYLTTAANAKWRAQSWSAIVYSKEPVVTQEPNPKGLKDSTATVTVTGTVQANLSGNGGYAFASASSPHQQGPPQVFELTKAGRQWRISRWPQRLLLTSDLFNYDYQLRNLYFFDPTTSYLVPDPVYVPLRATSVDLMSNLVKDLISPPGDWLSPGATTTAPGATTTAFPDGTRLNAVTLNGGTALVSLNIPVAKASAGRASAALKLQQKQEMSAQLLWTLSGSGQTGSAVQSVELSVNGTPFLPPGSQENPVQQLAQARYSPPDGHSSSFYFLDDGNLMQSQAGIQGGSVEKIGPLGQGYSQIAVSLPYHGRQYLAALSDGLLYTGPLGGKLMKQQGSGYTSISWDPSGNLWATTATGSDIVMLQASDSPGRPPGQPVYVTVQNSDGTDNPGPFTALRVAPDGVRVAIIVGGSILNFGAIVFQPVTRASQMIVKIKLSPFYVAQAGASMSAVTWYGPDNVITLSDSGGELTEYPVNGGSPASIQPQPGVRSITASAGSALIAGLANGGLVTDASLTSGWAPVPHAKKGISPVYPG